MKANERFMRHHYGASGYVEPDKPVDERQTDGTHRVRCMCCGKSVSSPLTAPVTVRAWVICPECIEQYGVDGGRATT